MLWDCWWDADPVWIILSACSAILDTTSMEQLAPLVGLPSLAAYSAAIRQPASNATPISTSTAQLVLPAQKSTTASDVIPPLSVLSASWDISWAPTTCVNSARTDVWSAQVPLSVANVL